MRIHFSVDDGSYLRAACGQGNARCSSVGQLVTCKRCLNMFKEEVQPQQEPKRKGATKQNGDSK